MSNMKNNFTHYTSAMGNDCYTPNFPSNVTRITVWNEESKKKIHYIDKKGLEISVEFVDGNTRLYKYSEFEAVLNSVYEGEDEDGE